jgi:thiol:disulfide interchange protein
MERLKKKLCELLRGHNKSFQLSREGCSKAFLLMALGVIVVFFASSFSLVQGYTGLCGGMQHASAKGTLAVVSHLLVANPMVGQLPYYNIKLIEIFFETLLLGFLAVFTPYVYAILPITVSYFSIISDSKKSGFINSLYYALFIVLIFTTFGFLIALLIKSTGLRTVTSHWLFNAVLCRLFLGLGLSFLGMFDLKLPRSWSIMTNARASVHSKRGIFFMALNLPIVSISSTGPIMALALVLAAAGENYGPIIGMLGFSLGFTAPFVFPVMIKLISASVTWLNHVKVLFGFFSMLLAVKFFSIMAIGLNWTFFDRDAFIFIWIALQFLLGCYMLGWIRLTNDYLHIENVFGQEYVSLSRLFVVIVSFTMVIYLLPGLWGAPLKGVSAFLPPY